MGSEFKRCLLCCKIFKLMHNFFILCNFHKPLKSPSHVSTIKDSFFFFHHSSMFSLHFWGAFWTILIQPLCMFGVGISSQFYSSTCLSPWPLCWASLLPAGPRLQVKDPLWSFLQGGLWVSSTLQPQVSPTITHKALKNLRKIMYRRALGPAWLEGLQLKKY